jgi:hypothetical protein
MGYRGGQLVDLAPSLEAGIDRFGRRTTAKVGEELRRRVRRHTPIAKPGSAAVRASYRNSGEWIRDRGGRRPGTLLESWRVGDVDVRTLGGGKTFTIPVFTLDRIAPFVEWETMPHLILPRHAKRLRFPTAGGMVFALLVHHPGTRGAHMMSRALLEVSVSWQVIAEREWQLEARQVWRLGRPTPAARAA